MSYRNIVIETYEPPGKNSGNLSPNIAHFQIKCIFYSNLQFNHSSCISVNIYESHVTNHKQEDKEKNHAVYDGTKMSPHSISKLKIITYWC